LSYGRRGGSGEPADDDSTGAVAMGRIARRGPAGHGHTGDVATNPPRGVVGTASADSGPPPGTRVTLKGTCTARPSPYAASVEPGHGRTRRAAGGRAGPGWLVKKSWRDRPFMSDFRWFSQDLAGSRKRTAPRPALVSDFTSGPPNSACRAVTTGSTIAGTAPVTCRFALVDTVPAQIRRGRGAGTFGGDNDQVKATARKGTNPDECRYDRSVRTQGHTLGG
jgi:hypothetical protein